MKRIIGLTIAALLMAGVVQAATKTQLLARIAASPLYVAVGDALPLDEAPIGMGAHGEWFSVVALRKLDSTSVDKVHLFMWEVGGLAYWQAGDPLASRRTPDIDSIRAWFFDNNGVPDRENAVRGWVSGIIYRPITGQPDSLRAVNVVGTWTGSAVNFKRIRP